ncbi:zinc ribbon domain-containing protein [bacterium]|jgi:putative FmdB family regulatory protein|nr:zinc ribbon domain-containing protein [bacterium]
MPIYEYRSSQPPGCPHCQTTFEVMQSMASSPLETCPECSGPVEKVFSTTALHGTGSTGDVLSNKNLAAKGFTKYQKAGDGHYERVAGSGGPQVIQK